MHPNTDVITPLPTPKLPERRASFLKPLLFLGGAAALILPFVLLDFGPAPRTVNLRETDFTRAAEKEARETAALAPLPTGYDAMQFTPVKILNELLDHLVGTKIAVPIRKLPGLEFELRDVELNTGFAQSGTSLKFRAKSGGVEIADLICEGRLVFMGASENVAMEEKQALDAALANATGEEKKKLENKLLVLEKSKARFGIVLDRVTLERELFGIKLAPKRWIEKLTEAAVLQHLEKYLGFDLPLPAEIAYIVSYNKVHSLNAGKGTVDVRVEMNTGVISQKLGRLVSVAVPGGIWIGGSAGLTTPSATPMREDVPLSQVLAGYESMATDHGRTWVSGKFMVSAIEKLTAKKPQERTARFQATNHTGTLAEKRFRADPFGEGGVFVSLDKNEASGFVTFTPHAKMTEDGLEVGMHVSGEGRAQIRTQLDPWLGRGIGITTGTHGEVSGDALALMRIKLVEKDGVRAFVATPELKHGSARVKGGTNDTMKFKIFGNAVSLDLFGIGASAELEVPAEMLPTLPLLTNEPHSLVNAKTEAYAAKNGVTFPETLHNLHLVLEPRTISTANGGYFAEVGAKLVTFESRDAAQFRDHIRVTLVQAKPHSKLRVGKVEVAIGDLKIGTKNDLVRFLLDTVNFAVNTAKEVTKAAKNVARETEKTAKSVGKAAEKTWKDTSRAVEKGWKDGVAAAEKAKRDAIAAADKAKRDALAAAEKAAKDLADAAEKAKRDALAAAEKAAKDLADAAEKAKRDAIATAEKTVKDAVKIARDPGRIFRRW